MNSRAVVARLCILASLRYLKHCLKIIKYNKNNCKIKIKVFKNEDMCIVKSLFMEKLQTPHFECEVLYKYLIFSKHEYAICEYTGDI